MELLENELGDYFLPRSLMNEWKITLHEIWATKKRLILSYNHNIHYNTSTLWSPIKYSRKDAQDLQDLKKFIAGEEYTAAKEIIEERLV